MDEQKENAFADPTLWQPDRDKTTQEPIPGQVIEGTYVGFTPFEFEEGQTTYCLTIDTGNSEFFALPSWFKIKQYVSMNAARFIEGKTKVRLVFKRMQHVGGQSLADFDLFADDVRVAKPLLTIQQLKEIHAGKPAPEIA
jgi:hypothetical protein